MLASYLTPQTQRALIERWREEDMGPEAIDLTSRCCIEPGHLAQAVVAARTAGVLAGASMLPLIAAVYSERLVVTDLLEDGTGLDPDDDHLRVIARIQGPLADLLAMERVALNLIGQLSGVASMTADLARRIAHTRARICDTRKTLVGLRSLQKYAVACGGGVNHRMGLYDAVLIKDNHIAHLPGESLGEKIEGFVDQARAMHPAPQFIEVEVDRLDQLRQVLACRVDMVLLDNMDPPLLRQAVALRDQMAPDILLEASGGIGPDTVVAVAETGVDRISVGALTHSAPCLDVGLDVERV